MKTSITKIITAFVLTVLTCITSIATPQDSTELAGRWDLTVVMDGKENPSWLEVTHSGFRTWVGRFVGVWGSARPISEVKIKGNTFSFSIPPQWEQGDGDMSLQGTFENNKLSGKVTFPDGKEFSFTGVKAPSLQERTAGRWGTPVQLIKANSLDGWKALGDNQWIVENGILKSPKSGANLVSEQKFQDFKLHVEFRYPEGSNSGVYLRGRHELQISDSKGKQADSHEFGGIYGFIAPIQQVAKSPGEWQSYDIELVGRKVTVVANGVTIICNQEIPGITGGALDSNEGQPGPLLLQGDHGPIEYRNITVTPMK